MFCFMLDSLTDAVCNRGTKCENKKGKQNRFLGCLFEGS